MPVFLISAVSTALAVAAAVLLAPSAARGALTAAGVPAAVLLCAAVTAAAHGRQAARAAQRRLESATQDVGRLLQERARQAEEFRRQHEQLSGELTRERARLTAELAQERTRLADALAAERDRLAEEHTAETARLAEEHAAERARLTREHDRLAAEHVRLAARLREATSARAAALSATANAAGRMQALATGMLADLRAMEEKHTDEEVLSDLLHLDHRTAQAGRLADSVAVLTGARSGRRWARPIGMESILRGAMGRIGGYQRVRIHSASDTAVAGHAAEGVMHALAELLDNAANFSPPTAEVHVYVEEVPSGVIVSVEDSGLVMGEAQLRRAERAVSGEVTGIGGLTGTRLGLAVVGRLARRYGLKVSYRPSARGGTGVLMLIPQDILVSPDAPTLPRNQQDEPRNQNATPDRNRTATADRTPDRSPDRNPNASPDRDPEPTHDFPDRSTSTPTSTPTSTSTTDESADESADAQPHGLPRRRRGRTLAEAERARSADRAAATSRPAPTAEETKARTARFSSFRNAVRGPGPGETTLRGVAVPPPPDPDPEVTPSGTSQPLLPHPEGDTTS
ncbi:histidine kinase [Streptomyces fumigatiscleroticus]|nr:histidine kinase [Streptomyces fumigatiscleroticus]